MKTLLIINPISGKARRSLPTWQDTARHYFPQAEITFTQHAGHATVLAAQAVQAGYAQVLVAGGDGTLNETARALVGTQTALGIIAKGSGNGLARELGLPLQYEKALAALQHAQVKACDVGKANEDYFFNVAGVGIEAEIALQFARHGQSGRRGKWPYFKLGAQAILKYQPRTLQVQYHNKTETLTPLSLVFANGTQYGSGFYIAPQASLSDGLLDMVEVKNVSKWRLLCAAPKFFIKRPLPPCLVRTQQLTQAHIHADGEIVYHLDGEPKTAPGSLHISVLPGALRLLVP